MTRLFPLVVELLVACAPSGDGVELVFLDVGQGDAIVVRSPEGNVALIDAGNDAEILPLLDWLGVTAIDLVIASGSPPVCPGSR